MTTRANTKKLHTTLGGLIVAIMDAARDFAAAAGGRTIHPR